MTTIIVFKIKDLKGFEKDPLIKKVNWKLKNNYNFKHIIKGKYLLTPDLTQLIKEPYKVKGVKEYALLLYILTLYKHAVKKGYLELFKTHTSSKDILFNEAFKSLVNYILDKGNDIYYYASEGYGIYRKNKVIADPYICTEAFYRDKNVTEHLLELPLTRIKNFFNTVNLKEYYTIRDNKIIRLSPHIKDIQDLKSPPVVALLYHYAKTGELLKPKGDSPIAQLIRNFNAYILFTLPEEPKNYKITPYQFDIISKDNTPNLDTEKLKKYYELLKNLVSVNEEIAFYLWYTYLGSKDVGKYFNPPLNTIKKVLERIIESDIRFSSITKLEETKIELVWNTIKTSEGEYPCFVGVRNYYKGKDNRKKPKEYEHYYGVFNNVENRNEENIKYITITKLQRIGIIRATYNYHEYDNKTIKVSVSVV